MILCACSHPVAGPPDEVEALFQKECTGCHGPDGSASSPAAKRMGLRDLRSPEVQKATDEELATMLAEGTKNMPGYQQRLGEDKVGQLVAYIRRIALKK